MKFGHIEIFVPEPLKAMAFYQDILMCDVEAVQHEQFVWLQLGGQTILLRPGQPKQAVDAYEKASSGFVLYTDNIEQTKRLLQERGLQFRGTDGSDTCLTFSDPDGNWFQLVDPSGH